MRGARDSDDRCETRASVNLTSYSQFPKKKNRTPPNPKTKRETEKKRKRGGKRKKKVLFLVLSCSFSPIADGLGIEPRRLIPIAFFALFTSSALSPHGFLRSSESAPRSARLHGLLRRPNPQCNRYRPIFAPRHANSCSRNSCVKAARTAKVPSNSAETTMPSRNVPRRSSRA